jgi:hypothetical protein
VFPARYELNSYIVFRKRLVSRRLISRCLRSVEKFAKMAEETEDSEKIHRIPTLTTLGILHHYNPHK